MLEYSNITLDVPPIQRDHLLRQKLRQCMEIFDFSDENIDLRPKEQKRKILEEILAHVATREALKPDIYPEYLLMVYSRLFKLGLNIYLKVNLRSIK